MEIIYILFVVIAVFLVPTIWAVGIQRTAVQRQKQAIDTQLDAVERQKLALARTEEGLELSRRQVENQERIIALLEEIRDKVSLPT